MPSLTTLPTVRLAGIAVLTLGLAACATDSGPAASAPPASQSSLGGNPAMTPAAARGGSMGTMDHSNMPGMARGGAQGGMAGMDHSTMPGMGGMNMQQMMAHCQQMRADVARGVTLSPDMQQMMAHCNMMGGSQPASGRR